MFVRTKKSPNTPKTAVQIVENYRIDNKVKQKIIRHVGSASNAQELENLTKLAQYLIVRMEVEESPQLSFFTTEELLKIIIEARQKKQQAQQLVDINNLREEKRVTVGIHEVFGQIYKEIGYEKAFKNSKRQVSASKKLFNIVMARLANTSSKRASVIELEKKFGISIALDSVYKMMDKIDDEVIERIKEITFQDTKTLLNNDINLVFYDATTLYFESFVEDDLRQKGYSKDMKFNQQGQVLLAILVSNDGLPLGYELYPGATYEGNTLPKSIETLKNKYKVGKISFVADSGLFNEVNIKFMEDNGYDYIVGARIKNTSKSVQKEILDVELYDEISDDLKYRNLEYNNKRLIVTRSRKRAEKDRHDREDAVAKLIKKIGSSSNPESLISNYGYKKYLNISGNSTVTLNEEKIQAAEKWDGIHGIITDIKDKSASEILSHYKRLWQVEETFRISKTDLKIRPIYHYSEQRIKAHIAICFMALECARNLEYRVKNIYKKLSYRRIRDELLSVQVSILKDKSSGKSFCISSEISEIAYRIYRTVGIKIDTVPFELV
jgi:transposase